MNRKTEDAVLGTIVVVLFFAALLCIGFGVAEVFGGGWAAIVIGALLLVAMFTAAEKL